MSPRTLPQVVSFFSSQQRIGSLSAAQLVDVLTRKPSQQEQLGPGEEIAFLVDLARCQKEVGDSGNTEMHDDTRPAAMPTHVLTNGQHTHMIPGYDGVLRPIYLG